MTRYAFEIYSYQDTYNDGVTRTSYGYTLHEMTDRELREAQASAPAHVRYERVDAARAHRFVRNDGVHTTGLWIDCDGRMRYARAE
jgi:hypothetical protein